MNYDGAAYSPRSSRLNEKTLRKGYLRNAAAIVGLTLLGTVPSLAFGSTQPIDFVAYFESRGAL